MLKNTHFMILPASLIVACFFASGCSIPKPWPESPLYAPPANDTKWDKPTTKEEAMAAMAGHYAHYDIVAYDGQTPNGPLSTFVISYGYTDLVLEEGNLVEYDYFCHAEYKANQNFTTTISDRATQAIKPRKSIVTVYEEDGNWKLYRPPTPALIGIDGDPDVPLTTNPNDTRINDADGDGKPGITVSVKLYGLIAGEIYIVRREVFQNYLTLYPNGSLFGHVKDDSEQLVLDATLGILNAPNNPPQWDDLGLSPLLLIPVPDDMDTCEELMENRDRLFPPEPDF